MATHNTSKKKILIIEDDKFLARALTSKLKKEKFEVQTLTEGSTALETIKKLRPHMVLLDLMMPKVDGFTVLEQVRADEEIKDTLIIVLSNLGQKSDTDATEELGALEHMVKSDTPLAVIVQRIVYYLDKYDK